MMFKVKSTMKMGLGPVSYTSLKQKLRQPPPAPAPAPAPAPVAALAPVAAPPSNDVHQFEEIKNHIHNNFKNNKLKKVVNVFQLTYVNDKSQGFGDFLRGSIYLTHICELLNVAFDIHLNHPIRICFVNQENEYESMNQYKVCAYIDKLNRRNAHVINFINCLNGCHSEIAYVYCNYDPRFDIENPKYGIIVHARNIIIPKIKPTELVLNLMDKKLAEINIQRKQYKIIHVRLGDRFMIKGKTNYMKHKHIFQAHMSHMMNDIQTRLNKNEKYIILGDNNIAKKIVSKKFNNVFLFDSEIIHLGEKTNLIEMNERTIIDTFIDFCIIQHSLSVVSYSVYTHGSGFSKQCTNIYDIPFQQIQLHPEVC